MRERSILRDAPGASDPEPPTYTLPPSLLDGYDPEAAADFVPYSRPSVATDIGAVRASDLRLYNIAVAHAAGVPGSELAKIYGTTVSHMTQLLSRPGVRTLIARFTAGLSTSRRQIEARLTLDMPAVYERLREIALSGKPGSEEWAMKELLRIGGLGPQAPGTTVNVTSNTQTNVAVSPAAGALVSSIRSLAAALPAIDIATSPHVLSGEAARPRAAADPPRTLVLEPLDPAAPAHDL